MNFVPVLQMEFLVDICSSNIAIAGELSRCYTLKLLALAETSVKHVSAGVAPCSRVGFVKLFELPLRDKFHEK